MIKIYSIYKKTSAREHLSHSGSLSIYVATLLQALPLTMSLYISPMINIGDVQRNISTQSIGCNACTVNISPPNVTITTCPIRIMNATSRKLPECLMSWNALLPLMNALALNMFQNCMNTNTVKNTDNS